MQTVGVILILSACLLLDRAYGERAGRGVLLLGELCDLFEHFGNRLSQGVRPLSSLVSGIEAKELSRVGFITLIKSGEVPLIAYRAVRDKLALSQQTDAMLSDFFTYATRGTGTDMQKACLSVHKALKEEYTAKGESVAVKRRIGRVVIFSLGLGLAISVI